MGPWRTSPSPTPGPLPPDGGDVGEGPGRFTPFPELPAHGAPRRASPTGAGGAPSTNAIESASDQLRKGDQEPRSLLSSDEAAVELLWPADPQQRRARPRARQGPGQTRQQTHRPTPSHPRPTHHQLETSPRPTHHRLPRPDHPLPLTRIHRKTDRLRDGRSHSTTGEKPTRPNGSRPPPPSSRTSFSSSRRRWASTPGGAGPLAGIDPGSPRSQPRRVSGLIPSLFVDPPETPSGRPGSAKAPQAPAEAHAV